MTCRLYSKAWSWTWLGTALLTCRMIENAYRERGSTIARGSLPDMRSCGVVQAFADTLVEEEEVDVADQAAEDASAAGERLAKHMQVQAGWHVLVTLHRTLKELTGIIMIATSNPRTQAQVQSFQTLSMSEAEQQDKQPRAAPICWVRFVQAS